MNAVNTPQGETEASSLEQTVDEWPIAIAAIDACGHVKFANMVARELFLKLQLSEVTIAGQLRLVNGSALDLAIKDRQQSVSISFGDSKNHSLLKLFYPDNKSLSEALIVADSRQHCSNVQSKTYGLSRAEKEVVDGLLNGQSLREISEARNTSKNTIRSQLRSIFKKTGTSRQAQLVSFFLDKQR